MPTTRKRGAYQGVFTQLTKGGIWHNEVMEITQEQCEKTAKYLPTQRDGRKTATGITQARVTPVHLFYTLRRLIRFIPESCGMPTPSVPAAPSRLPQGVVIPQENVKDRYFSKRLRKPSRAGTRVPGTQRVRWAKSVGASRASSPIM